VSSQRHIAHFDLDAFFVEVELLTEPGLRGLPLIVGGSRERGVVTTCSYEARAFGVRSAMSMREALMKCPQALVLPGSRGQYSRYSRWVTDIIASAAPVFEKASIDEFYLDLTGMDRYHDPLKFTIDLRRRITEETGLPISFGLASNKMVAKMATNEAKPNGYLQIPPGLEQAFLAPLPVERIPGVGDHTLRRLQDLGIKSISDLAAFPVEVLSARLGQYGRELHQKAYGIHDGVVAGYHETKSISTENTFEQNVSEEDFLMTELVRMTEKIAAQLRKENMMTGCLAVKLRYPDFETTSRQRAIAYTCYDDELIPVAKELFRQLYRPGNKVRLLGVRLSELTNGAMQTNLFSDPERKSDLYKAIDAVRDRFGKSVLTRGGAIRGSNEQ
jgi:DNA polymerase-4